MRRLIGLDINGWRDFGCRDWSVEEPDEIANPPVVLDGGIQSVSVEHDGWLVGGPQAILAPIGRGKGWSKIGDPGKRRRLADHWPSLLAGTPDPTFGGDVGAVAAALSQMADQRVVCIPDHAAMGEFQQKQLLTALDDTSGIRSILLWRSVALVLGLLDEGSLPDAGAGMRIACLIQGTDGIERQSLVLRQLEDQPDWLAPERAGPGDICCPALSLRRLIERADVAVLAANPVLGTTQTDTPVMAANLLFHEALHAEEIVRRNNGNWLKLVTPQDFVLDGLGEAIESAVIDADCIVLLSPLAARHRDELWYALAGSATSRPVILADPETAARGALFAARRIERGIPHYLDHLDQISLIVEGRTGPVWADLIPSKATVPGNREYVSAPITSMASVSVKIVVARHS